MHLDLKSELTAGCGGRGRGYLDVHGLPAAEGQGGARGAAAVPRRARRVPSQLQPRQRHVEGGARVPHRGHRPVRVAAHDGGAPVAARARRGGARGPGVAAVVGDAADLQHGHPGARAQDVQRLPQTQARQRDARDTQ